MVRAFGEEKFGFRFLTTTTRLVWIEPAGFVSQLANKLGPRRVVNVCGQMFVAGHAFHVQIFDHNHVKVFDRWCCAAGCGTGLSHGRGISGHAGWLAATGATPARGLFANRF